MQLQLACQCNGERYHNMKELLTEFFAGLLGEAKEVKKPDNAKFSVPGGRYYTKDPAQGGEYVGRVSDGKWIAATPEEKQADKERRASQKPAAQKKVAAKKAPAKGKQTTKPSRPSKPEIKSSLNSEELKRIESEYVDDEGAESDEMNKKFSTKSYSRTDLPKEYSDAAYYSTKNGGRGHSTKVRKKPFLFDKKTRTALSSQGFPEKYIKFMERCINTQISGKKPPVTELVDVGGAGQIASQFGEVVSMAMMSIRDPEERRKFSELIKSQIEKSKEEIGAPIADGSWVDAAVTHAEAFDAAMDEKYGKGKWKFEGASWDIRSDVEALGLPYENKGFSTDVILRVNTPEGPKAQRVSLKKDERIMFFNGSVGEVNNFVLNYTDETSRKRIRMLEQLLAAGGASNKNLEQRERAKETIKKLTGETSSSKAEAKLKEEISQLRNAALQSAPPEVQKLVADINSFSSTQLNAGVTLARNIHKRNAKATPKQVSAAIEAEFSGKEAADREYAQLAWNISKQCSKENNYVNCVKDKLEAAGEDTGTDRVAKVCVFAGRIATQLGDKKSAAELNGVYQIGRDIGRRLMESIPEHPEMMGGVMQKLASSFPLKVCMAGTEMMMIDGIKITQQTLKTVFGTEDYADLEQGLDILRLPTGESILVYKVKGSNKPIPIGYVRGRQKGLGYEGTVGFEIECSDDFALACAEANRTNGDQSRSNAMAINRVGGRVAKRQSGTKKKKGK